MLTKMKSFLQEAKQELHKVNWPSKEETIKMTMVVIFISLAVSIYLGALDLVFAKLLKLLTEY
ncbi:MAG: preprotein translocase subunit SecE [Candidatus Pacebacteria bacterium]|nr:preprotein translocase subunit SecE [Candidatus Paceibacterota bacterium]